MEYHLLEVENRKYFLKLNPNEIDGVIKILYISNIKYYISDISKYRSNRNRSVKGIYPIGNRRTVEFYENKLNIKDKILFIFDRYLLVLDNMDELMGCLTIIKLLNMDDSKIELIGMEIPNVNLASKIVNAH